MAGNDIGNRVFSHSRSHSSDRLGMTDIFGNVLVGHGMAHGNSGQGLPYLDLEVGSSDIKIAVGLSTLVYFLVAVVFSGAMVNVDLVSGYDAMKQIALVPGLIDAGVIAATLSSAMASFLGSPRILQSIAKDRIFNSLTPFGKGVGITDNPRRGVWLSGSIAMTGTGDR